MLLCRLLSDTPTRKLSPSARQLSPKVLVPACSLPQMKVGMVERYGASQAKNNVLPGTRYQLPKASQLSSEPVSE